MEVGVGGDVINKARNLLLESGVYPLDDKGKRLNLMQNIIVKTLQQVMKAAGPTISKASKPYLSISGMVLIVKGTTLLNENETVLAPKIKELNPEYYNKNIERIYPDNAGGAGNSIDY